MKVFAAALCALSVAAVRLQQEGTEPEFKPPQCGAVPEIPEGFTDTDIFLFLAGDDL